MLDAALSDIRDGLVEEIAYDRERGLAQNVELPEQELAQLDAVIAAVTE